MLIIACVINHIILKEILIFNDRSIAKLQILFQSKICEESAKYR